MLPDPKIRCPATGFAKSCKEIITKYKCPKWVQLRGRNPQTGADVDEWNCVDAFLPMLLLENSQQTRQAGAAVESFRNEMVKSSENLNRTIVHCVSRETDIKLLGRG